jgi:hypothetical protein
MTTALHAPFSAPPLLSVFLHSCPIPPPQSTQRTLSMSHIKGWSDHVCQEGFYLFPPGMTAITSTEGYLLGTSGVSPHGLHPHLVHLFHLKLHWVHHNL